MSDEKRDIIVPDDYRPTKPMSYLALDLSLAKEFDRMTDHEVVTFCRTLMKYAATGEMPDYSSSELFNDRYFHLVVETAIKAHDIRAEDYRKTSYRRSKANGGGRPSNKTSKT